MLRTKFSMNKISFGCWEGPSVYPWTTIETHVYSHINSLIYLFQSTRPLTCVSNMHYTSFSLQNISHDWNDIQTRPSVTYPVSLTCQFSNAKFYEYFMDSVACHSSTHFVNFRIRSTLPLHYIAIMSCSYFTSGYVIDSHLMFKVIIPSLF